MMIDISVKASGVELAVMVEVDADGAWDGCPQVRVASGDPDLWLLLEQADDCRLTIFRAVQSHLDDLYQPTPQRHLDGGGAE